MPPAHGGGHSDDEHDHGRHLGRLHQRFVHVAPGEVAQDESRNYQRVDARHHGGLGGREHAAQDAAQNDDGHEQGWQSLQRRFAHIAPASELLILGEVVALGVIDVEADQQRSEQHSRHDATDKHGRNRNRARRNGVDNEDVAGRHDGGQDGAGRGNGGGVAALVALFGHHFDFDGAQAHGFGVGGTADAAKEHAGQHVGVRQAAAEVAADGVAEQEDAFCDAAAGHDVGGEDEEHQQQKGNQNDDCFHGYSTPPCPTDSKGLISPQAKPIISMM